MPDSQVTARAASRAAGNGNQSTQITSLTIVYSTVYSDADQRKHQSSASLAFVWGIHRGPVNSPHKWPVTRKMFPFDDVIMTIYILCSDSQQTRLEFNFDNVICPFSSALIHCLEDSIVPVPLKDVRKSGRYIPITENHRTLDVIITSLLRQKNVVL